MMKPYKIVLSPQAKLALEKMGGDAAAELLSTFDPNRFDPSRCLELKCLCGAWITWDDATNGARCASTGKPVDHRAAAARAECAAALGVRPKENR